MQAFLQPLWIPRRRRQGAHSTRNPQSSSLTPHPSLLTLTPQPSILYTQQSALNTQPQPSTLNPQPSTLHPQPSTFNPQTSTLKPQPQSPNPQPSTPNPHPSTFNPGNIVYYVSGRHLPSQLTETKIGSKALARCRWGWWTISSRREFIMIKIPPQGIGAVGLISEGTAPISDGKS